VFSHADVMGNSMAASNPGKQVRSSILFIMFILPAGYVVRMLPSNLPYQYHQVRVPIQPDQKLVQVAH